ncbi:hypothetical protein FACS189429_2820 [Bacteroidia bacterium]|nr:hypothetical protein FACS189429_2820 [Bacteroidia bacterium]GHV43750.1 hypothetical protein FACS1894180_3770 [Bacteroidia bacterium]
MKIIPNNSFFSEIEKFISAGESVTIMVKGRSMMPLLRNGRDAVVLSPVDTKNLQAGQIVLFRHNDRHLLHRIVKTDGENLVIQGDGTRTTENATRADVVGVVTAIVRWHRKQIPLPNKWEKRYFRVWCLLKPFRRYLLWAFRKISRIFFLFRKRFGMTNMVKN